MLSIVPRFAPWPVPRVTLDSGPGPQALLKGNYDHGWYGEVDSSDLISGSALASRIGLSVGTLLNSATPWLKFAYQGKFLFMPKLPIRVDVSWNDILAAAAVYGETEITIGVYKFKVRLPKGALTDPAVIVSGGSVQWGSEWDKTFGFVRGATSYVTASQAFAAYTSAEVATTTDGNQAYYNMCAESINAAEHIKRQDTAVYNVVTAKSWSRDDYCWRPILEYVGRASIEADPTLFLQYTFNYGEAINEVTETFAQLNGSASVAGSALVTVAASDVLEAHPILLDTDAWTIETKFSYVSTSANMGLIGVWNGNGNTATRWYLLWEGVATAMRVYFRNASGQIIVSASMPKPAANTEHHVELSYANGTFYMFLNGVLATSQVADGRNAAGTSTPLSMISGNNTFNGKRWATRIHKGKALHTENFTPPTALTAVGRSTYTEEEAADLRVQIDLRRDAARNEVNGRAVQTYGTSRHVRSRILHTNANSSYFFAPCDYFGAGDFTIEVKFNLTAVQSTYGALILGQWHYGAQTNDNNCWFLHASPARILSFGISKSPASSDYSAFASNTAFAFGVDNHVVIERVQGVVSMYLNGILVVQGVDATPIRKVSTQFIRSGGTSNLYSMAGNVWDVRIADRPMYSGEIVVLPQFPKLPDWEEYSSEVLNDIVVQCDLRDGNARNAKTGELLTFSGTGVPVRERLVTTLANTSRWYIPCAYFGAGDFTIEFDIVFISHTGASSRPFFGQFQGGAGPNSWVFYTSASGNVVFQANGADAASVSIDTATGPAKYQVMSAGREYHVVAERVNGVLSMYIDGDLIGSAPFASALVDMTGYPITNLYDLANSKYCATEIGNVRVAKRALYNGAVVKTRLPKIPNQKPSLTMNIGSAIGSLAGACQNLYYGGEHSSLGTFSHTLFRDIRDPMNVKTVRLVALALDRSYALLAWREIDMPPTDDMPQFTDALKIGDAAPLLISNSGGASVSGGAIGRYWGSGSAQFGTAVAGKCIPFEFV